MISESFWTQLHRDAIGLTRLGTGLLFGAWLRPANAALLGVVTLLVAAVVLTITTLRQRSAR